MAWFHWPVFLTMRASKPRRSGIIDWTLDHQAPNGMIGPASNNDWWPRIVMLKALTQYQEFTGDSRVIPVMDRYLRYQIGQLAQRATARLGQVPLAG